VPWQLVIRATTQSHKWFHIRGFSRQTGHGFRYSPPDICSCPAESSKGIGGNDHRAPSWSIAVRASYLALRGTRDPVQLQRYDRDSGVGYFAGNEFTAADIMMLFPLTTMRAFAKRDLAPLPHIRAYLKRIGERPAYQRAMTKGDPGVSPMLT
jgi:hypothetical protein